jgi:5'-nucleotidase
VGEHLGPEWVPRTYIGLDKTRIQADFLVDDRPDITGVYRPTWEHVVFDRPYNRHITTHRRLTWLNWKRVLLASWLCLTFWAVGGI